MSGPGLRTLRTARGRLGSGAKAGRLEPAMALRDDSVTGRQELIVCMACPSDERCVISDKRLAVVAVDPHPSLQQSDSPACH
jgi:hypothetical protein